MQKGTPYHTGTYNGLSSIFASYGKHSRDLGNVHCLHYPVADYSRTNASCGVSSSQQTNGWPRLTTQSQFPFRGSDGRSRPSYGQKARRHLKAMAATAAMSMTIKIQTVDTYPILSINAPARGRPSANP